MGSGVSVHDPLGHLSEQCTDEAADEFIALMFEFTPDDVAETLAPAVQQVIASRRGDLLTIGILGTLWAASSGLEALRAALNRAYDVEQWRAIWWRRLQSIVLVVLCSLAFFVASVSVVIGPLIWELLDQVLGLETQDRWAWIAARYTLGIAALFGVVLLLHKWLPNRWHPFRALAPGVLVTLVLWVLVSTALSIYLGTIGDYSATYGALGGVAITLLFFYLAGLSFILGAEINGHLWRQRHPEHKAEPVAESP